MSTNTVYTEKTELKLDCNFIDANEKYVASVILYAKDSEESDAYLYTDAGFTTTIDRVNLLNLLKKGLVIVSYEDAFYAPITFKDATTEATLTIATAVNASTSASVELKSKEPVEA